MSEYPRQSKALEWIRTERAREDAADVAQDARAELEEGLAHDVDVVYVEVDELCVCVVVGVFDAAAIRAVHDGVEARARVHDDDAHAGRGGRDGAGVRDDGRLRGVGAERGEQPLVVG